MERIQGENHILAKELRIRRSANRLRASPMKCRYGQQSLLWPGETTICNCQLCQLKKREYQFISDRGTQGTVQARDLREAKSILDRLLPAGMILHITAVNNIKQHTTKAPQKAHSRA